jgi:hypothetical protein
MAKSIPILSGETDTAHFVAQGVLCALAGACVLGMIWAVGNRNGPQVEEHPIEDRIQSVKKSFPEPREPTPAPSKLDKPDLRTGLSALPAPGVPSTASLPSNPPKLTDLLTPLRPVVPADRQLKNPQVIEAVEAAREVRKLGDMATALESLRAADLREPNHPEILGEMALTYEAMGLGDKSAVAWKSVLDMGEAAAGGYYTLARSKLDGRDSSPAPQPTQSSTGGPVSLGNCQVLRDTSVTQGERITVRVPILAASGAVIDPTQMDIHVFLFEKINDGERIEQVRAEQPGQNWVSAPVDWREPGGESIDVTYDLPPPKPEEMRNLGKRSFHGFIVKLFYQNKLAGEQAEPLTLLDPTQQPTAPAGVDNALFPK